MPTRSQKNEINREITSLQEKVKNNPYYTSNSEFRHRISSIKYKMKEYGFSEESGYYKQLKQLEGDKEQGKLYDEFEKLNVLDKVEIGIVKAYRDSIKNVGIDCRGKLIILTGSNDKGYSPGERIAFVPDDPDFFWSDRKVGFSKIYGRLEESHKIAGIVYDNNHGQALFIGKWVYSSSFLGRDITPLDSGKFNEDYLYAIAHMGPNKEVIELATQFNLDQSKIVANQDYRTIRMATDPYRSLDVHGEHLETIVNRLINPTSS